MRHFQTILYISQGICDECEGLNQALSIARNNEGKLKILTLCPQLPNKIEGYKQKYQEALIEQVHASLAKARVVTKVTEANLPVEIEVLESNTPAVDVIKQAIQQDADLVIKEAELRDSGQGFKALDMHLLRKCPCPVWLARPIPDSRSTMKVLVAIDPESHESASEQLSLRLLELADSLACSCNQTLEVISCWKYHSEDYLKDNVWVRVSDEALTNEIDQMRAEHRIALDALIEKAPRKSKVKVQHIAGLPEKVIPEFVRDHGIDILLMGTVARTGIAGFIFGNTAENIVQELSCSLVALKPNGFVSPVKA